MAETVDSQLKQMSTDLKMIIEQMNKSNTSADDENPVIKLHHCACCISSTLPTHLPPHTHTQFTQIVRILNAHTDSLGWIDHEAALLRKKVDDVAKVTDYHRREQEHSFRKLASINECMLYDFEIPYFMSLKEGPGPFIWCG